MKENNIFWFCFSCCLLIRCSDIGNVQQIRGTYARAVNNEFSIGRDTLVIELENEANTNYAIIHRGSFQRIKNGKVLRPEKINEKWRAIYDEKNELLREVKKGKIISFNFSKKVLFLGSSPYKKIK